MEREEVCVLRFGTRMGLRDRSGPGWVVGSALRKDQGRCIQAHVIIHQLAFRARRKEKGIIASSGRFAQHTVYRSDAKEQTMPYAFSRGCDHRVG